MEPLVREGTRERDIAAFFGPHSDDALRPGMTVCIDVSVFSVPEVHGVRFESGYLMTEGEAEPLSPFMDQKILTTRVEREKTGKDCKKLWITE